MKKLQILSIISIILLISNLALIWKITERQHPPHHNEGPKQIIIDRLQFDEAQIIEYEHLIEKHSKIIRETDGKITTLRKQLYNGLVVQQNYATRDSLITEIGQLQHAIEMINYHHFSDIKQLCKPEQQSLFNKLTIEMAQLFKHPPKHGL